MICKYLRLLGGGSSAAQVRPTGKPPLAAPRADELYPYVVPSAYLKHQPKEPAGLSRPLGHGLFVVLVLESGGLVRNVLQDDLTALKRTSEQTYSRALGNLETRIRNNVVGMTMLPKGPQGRPFILFGGIGPQPRASCFRAFGK
jgi:hypothetical protein